jgi:parallel beta-helix repeat protein
MSSRMRRLSLMTALAIFGATLLPIGPALAATTWVVDGTNPACNDFGAGNAAQPLCTLLRGTIRALPGDTVLVHPGVYREQVHPPSGTTGAPVTFRASGPGVEVVGSRDVSDPTQWTQVSGGIWRRSYLNPSGQPQMMYLDDTLLTKGTSATALAPNEWFWDNAARVLYANIGGGNPGDGHVIEVGALSFGFQLAGKTHVIVDGFELSRQNFHAVNVGPSSTGVPAGTLEVRNLHVEETGSYGINVDDANASAVDIVNNEVTRAGSHGIRLRNASNVDVLGNLSYDNLNSGFAVHAASGNRLVGNTAYGNENPRFRVANGIDANFAVLNGVDVGSSNNVFRNNVLYDNQDSGLQLYNGSHNNLVVRNISYGNGDHGFDTLRSTGTRYLSNTSYGNFRDGISIEGMSTGTRVHNNISVDNGIGQEGFDLFVDDDGTIQGLVSDYNLFWKSVPGTVVKVNDGEYASVAAFAQATTFEDHGVGANPRFVNAAAGDFHLLTGSPAIDSAHAGVAGFQQADLEGAMPKDDPAAPNTGAGAPPFADRGALEFDPPPPPNAVMSVSATGGMAPLQLTANGSGSSHPNGTIQSYTFDFGNGTVVGPQASPSAGHTYTRVGTYTVRMTVRDTRGAASTTSRQVTVTNSPPQAALSVSPALFGFIVQADASASRDNDGMGIASYTFNFGDGRVVGPTTNPRAVHFYSRRGTYTVTVRVTDTGGLSSTASRTVNVQGFFGF